MRELWTNAAVLARTFASQRERAMLVRTLATLRTEIALFDNIDQLRWNGPTPAFAVLGKRFDAEVTDAHRRPGGRSRQPAQ